VVLKPASDTPLTMLALMPILEEAGVPAGVSTSSLALVRQGGERHAARSARARRLVHRLDRGRPQAAAEAADNIVKPAMELGGNAPFIVFEDADIDAAIDGAMIAKMRNMGEACTAANRSTCTRKVHDEFAKKLTAKMARAEDGQRPRRRRERSAAGQQGRPRQGDRAGRRRVKKGAKVLTGGKAPAARASSIRRRSCQM
jgi:succinate-semialdehyde dehydrogenase/glutarate-semialdehyde dehydrogenase